MKLSIKKSRHTGHERRLARVHPLFVLMSLGLVAAIAFVTLCPIGLRPRLADPDVERFMAYFVLGAAFCFAAPRRWGLATSLIIILAFALEAGQLLVPGRDAHARDAVVKALGGVIGLNLASTFYPLKRLIKRLQTQQAAESTPVWNMLKSEHQDTPLQT